MTCVIYARDFNTDTRDPLREQWTVASMTAVVRALDGRKVALQTDTRVGTTDLGVTLEGVTPNASQPAVLVRYEGRKERLAHQLSNCGMILPLGAGETIPIGTGVDSTKWEALNLYREERNTACSAALAWAEKKRGAKTWGAVKASSGYTPGLWVVTYTPGERPQPDREPGVPFRVEVQVDDGAGDVVSVLGHADLMLQVPKAQRPA
ncbi:hypothetical protein ABZT26_36150 [Streptomyces sp. NPDC005395]|uniref:hypothetical protein n=1 Tax=Streptomyces sp. NPDC005395 TaxID=3157042 RepID=UPI0033AE33D9